MQIRSQIILISYVCVGIRPGTFCEGGNPRTRLRAMDLAPHPGLGRLYDRFVHAVDLSPHLGLGRLLDCFGFSTCLIQPTRLMIQDLFLS